MVLSEAERLLKLDIEIHMLGFDLAMYTGSIHSNSLRQWQRTR
jgi:hypothetical protein